MLLRCLRRSGSSSRQLRRAAGVTLHVQCAGRPPSLSNESRSPKGFLAVHPEVAALSIRCGVKRNDLSSPEQLPAAGQRPASDRPSVRGNDMPERTEIAPSSSGREPKTCVRARGFGGSAQPEARAGQRPRKGNRRGQPDGTGGAFAPSRHQDISNCAPFEQHLFTPTAKL